MPLAAVLEGALVLSCDNKVDVLKAAYSQTPRRMLKNDKVSVFKEQTIFTQICKVRAYFYCPCYLFDYRVIN